MSCAQGLTAELICQAHQRGDQDIVCGRLVVEMLQWVKPVGIIPSTHLHHASLQLSSLVNPLQRGTCSGDATHHRVRHAGHSAAARGSAPLKQ